MRLRRFFRWTSRAALPLGALVTAEYLATASRRFSARLLGACVRASRRARPCRTCRSASAPGPPGPWRGGRRACAGCVSQGGAGASLFLREQDRGSGTARVSAHAGGCGAGPAGAAGVSEPCFRSGAPGVRNGITSDSSVNEPTPRSFPLSGWVQRMARTGPSGWRGAPPSGFCSRQSGRAFRSTSCPIRIWLPVAWPALFNRWSELFSTDSACVFGSSRPFPVGSIGVSDIGPEGAADHRSPRLCRR